MEVNGTKRWGATRFRLLLGRVAEIGAITLFHRPDELTVPSAVRWRPIVARSVPAAKHPTRPLAAPLEGMKAGPVIAARLRLHEDRPTAHQLVREFVTDFEAIGAELPGNAPDFNEKVFYPLGIRVPVGKVRCNTPAFESRRIPRPIPVFVSPMHPPKPARPEKRQTASRQVPDPVFAGGARIRIEVGAPARCIGRDDYGAGPMRAIP